MADPGAGDLQQYLEVLERVPDVYRRAWDAIAIYDLEGRVVGGNSAARLLIGDSFALGLVSRAEHFSSHLPMSDAAAAARTFAQVATKGVPFDTEMAFRDADGSPIPVAVRLVPARLDGKIVGVIGFARDQRAQLSAEAQFMRSEQQFRSIFENHPDAITLLDLQSRFTRINAGALALSGYSVDDLIGQTPAFLSPRGVWVDEERILAATLRGETAVFTSVIRTKSGELKNVEGRSIPLTVNGEVRGLYLLTHDVTEEHQREREAERQADRIAELYKVVSAPSLTASEKIDRALSNGMHELGADWAYTAQLHDGTMTVTHTAGVGDMQVGHAVDIERTMVRRAVEAREMFVAEDLRELPWRNELSERTKHWRGFVGLPLQLDGQLHGVLAFISTKHPLRAGPSDRDYLRAIAALIASATHQIAHEKRLDTLAFHDPLTGLPNRALLHDRLEQTLLNARRHRRSFAVHYIDVDHFKTINDSFGHLVGDAVLVAVGNWLRSTLRDSDTIARIGGDEFVVLQPEIDTQEQAEELAQRLVAIRDHPIMIGNQEFRVTVSVGGGVFPADARNPVDLLRAADTALYQVKARGRDGYSVGMVES